MTTTQSSRFPNWLPGLRKTVAPHPDAVVVVDATNAAVPTAQFVYAVLAALGLETVDFDDAEDLPDSAVYLQVAGVTITAGQHTWYHPDHQARFERWLVSQCFPHQPSPLVWAVVQTSTDVFGLLAAAAAWSHSIHGALLIDADATETLSKTILEAVDEPIEVLSFDFDMPSPHIYLRNAPRYADIALMLQANRANPLNSVLLPETLRAATQHFAHTVINCGADLFLAQRLADEGAQVIHVDDFSRPLYTSFTPYKRVNYFSHGMPGYATRRDIEFIMHNSRRRRPMRRWMQRGDQP